MAMRNLLMRNIMGAATYGHHGSGLCEYSV
jgi:hypothetical protein